MPIIAGSENRFPKIRLVEGAAAATPAAGEVHLYVKADGLLYWKDDAGTEYAVGTGDVAAHLADTADAHDASAISFTPAGTIAATDVQAAIEEVAAEAGGGSLTDHTHAVTGSGATGGGDTLNPVTLNASGLVRFSGSITSTVNADQNDYAPTGIHQKAIIRFTSFTAARTITGIDAGSDGEVLILVNNTGQNLLLPNESGSSAAANRFRTPAAATVTVRQSGTVWCIYAGGRWCVMGI